jgi:hypothetical protein
MADLFNAEWQQACVPAGQKLGQRFIRALFHDNDATCSVASRTPPYHRWRLWDRSKRTRVGKPKAAE